jgi:hypothetical protein
MDKLIQKNCSQKFLSRKSFQINLSGKIDKLIRKNRQTYPEKWFTENLSGKVCTNALILTNFLNSLGSLEVNKKIQD